MRVGAQPAEVRLRRACTHASGGALAYATRGRPHALAKACNPIHPTQLPPAPVAQGLPRGAWHYQWSFFDPQHCAWRAARVETHQAALAAAPAAPAAPAAAAAAAAALVIMVVRVARPILVIEGHGTLRSVHAVGCAARRAGSEGRVHVQLEIRRGHRIATAAAIAAAIAAIAAAAAIAVAAVGAEAEASVERGL